MVNSEELIRTTEYLTLSYRIVYIDVAVTGFNCISTNIRFTVFLHVSVTTCRRTKKAVTF
jgi:hypothetical protein